MNGKKVVSLAEYKARILPARIPAERRAAVLPAQNRLWELLDRNISLAVWSKGH